MASKFNKGGYSAIYAKEGKIIDESFVEELKRMSALHVEERKVARDKDQIAVTVYVNTDRLKEQIKKSEHLQGLLSTTDVTISDIVSAGSLQFSRSGVQRGVRLPADSYVRKTMRGDRTFAKEVQTSGESEWPDRIKRYGPTVALTAMGGAVVTIGVMLARTTSQLAEDQAKMTERALDIDPKKLHDGLDDAIKVKGSKNGASFEEKEKERREKTEAEKKDSKDSPSPPPH